MMTAQTPPTIVLGFGQTGQSVARYLVSQGEEFAVQDSRATPLKTGDEFSALSVSWGGFNADSLQACKKMVVSPGISLKTPEIQAAMAEGVAAVGDIELFARAAQADIAAITGSNGKSSVTKLLEQMVLADQKLAYACGNIGFAALDCLMQPVPDVYSLEISSFQLETTQSLRAKVATVLNISPDHMDRYDSLDDYAAAKGVVYKNAEVAVVNREDPLASKLVVNNDQQISFGLDAPEVGHYGLREIDDALWLCCGHEPLVSINEIRLKGKHNLANILAAMALAQAVGVSPEAMVAAAKTFKGLPHRTQWVRTRRGVGWFNDSKGTNVGAAIAALNGFDGKSVLIAGGQGKGGDFAALATVAKSKARHVILIGEDADFIAAALEGKVQYSHAADMAEAVSLAAQVAKTGDNILLSPACASFDQFANYQARGDAFMTAVMELEA